tara:strand:+ start:136 stop:306 length:171 start_codon:yes stop_codon:yes gene_type:complete
MKVTETKIKQIIKEELEKLQNPDAIVQAAEKALDKLSPEEREAVEAYYQAKSEESR